MNVIDSMPNVEFDPFLFPGEHYDYQSPGFDLNE